MADELRDIFPSTILRRGDHEMKRLSRETFKNHAAEAYPFILFKPEHSEHVSYYGRMQMDRIHRERLYRLLRDSQVLREGKLRENVSWSRIEDILVREPLCERIKNNQKSDMNGKREHADIRLGFRFDNMFLVKKFFTFGLRKVNTGEVHIVQTSDVPLIYNEVKDVDKEEFSEIWSNGGQGKFRPEDQVCFKVCILDRFSVYSVPQNTIYVLISQQETLFSLDRVSHEMFNFMQNNAESGWKNVTFLMPYFHDRLVEEPPRKKMKPSCSNIRIDSLREWKYIDELKPPERIESSTMNSSNNNSNNYNHRIEIDLRTQRRVSIEQSKMIVPASEPPPLLPPPTDVECISCSSSNITGNTAQQIKEEVESVSESDDNETSGRDQYQQYSQQMKEEVLSLSESDDSRAIEGQCAIVYQVFV